MTRRPFSDDPFWPIDAAAIMALAAALVCLFIILSVGLLLALAIGAIK
jgi:hypothetical protein